MKIDLSTIDKTQFHVNERIINGELVYLVVPQISGTVWTQQNKIFRSSVWDHDGNLISAGFPKFTNWGESPAEFPTPTDLKGATLVEKIDGSLLVVSKYKGEYILRTRGTVDATQLENGHELEIFKQTILPKLYHFNLFEGMSFLFEWVSPTNEIVIKHEKPDWYFVGYIFHDDYRLATQEQLDEIAEEIGLLRPTTYTFSTISDLLDNVEKWEGKEGVVCYSKHGIHKVKSDWYLLRHHMRSEMSTIDKVLDYWFEQGRPDYQTLYDRLASFDYEIAQRSIGFMSRICDADKEVKQLIEGMKRFIQEQLMILPTRKLQAVVTFQSYGKTERAACVFSLLDGKQIDDKKYLKLMWQFLKKD